MKYPNENDSYSTWLKRCCKILLTPWKRTEEMSDSMDDIVNSLKDLFLSSANLFMLFFAPLFIWLAPLLAYYGRKSYIKSHKRMEELSKED